MLNPERVLSHARSACAPIEQELEREIVDVWDVWKSREEAR
jgi:hypothetical protein